MHKKFVTPAYLINMIMQALFGLAVPIGAMLFISYMLVKYFSVGSFIYAILVPIGAIFGLYSMIIFIVRASAALETVEKQHKERERALLMKAAAEQSNQSSKNEETNTKASEDHNEKINPGSD